MATTTSESSNQDNVTSREQVAVTTLWALGLTHKGTRMASWALQGKLNKGVPTTRTKLWKKPLNCVRPLDFAIVIPSSFGESPDDMLSSYARTSNAFVARNYPGALCTRIANGSTAIKF